jgi:DNA (cytosine-5)-methyltransferase 1
MTLRFGSVCSGIEAASVAFAPLGWKAAWLSEIDKFASAVLAHHYPAVKNLGDMTKIAKAILLGEVEAPDALCGGTPCQAFSVAGLRQSLADDRGNLTLKYVELLDAIDHVRGMRDLPACIGFWENVPGVLSTKDNAFGCFLAGLAGEDEPLVPPGGKWSNAGAVYGPKRAIAWRTLDAQYFGLAQRRRRVFVVASARNGFDPAQVLFEWEGVRRDSPPSREAREEPAATLAGGARKRGGYSHDDVPLAFGGNQSNGARDVASALTAHPGGRYDLETETFIAHAPEVAATMVARSSRGGGQTNSPGHNAHEELVVTHALRGEGFDASEDGTGRGTPPVPVLGFNAECAEEEIRRHELGPGSAALLRALAAKDDAACSAIAHVDVMPTMTCGGGHEASHNQVSGQMRDQFMVPTTAMRVRRLTTVECERLQGFPDGYTAIPWRGRPAEECPDGPRYKALGNSWAVPCARWIGERIQAHLDAISPAGRGDAANDGRAREAA